MTDAAPRDDSHLVAAARDGDRVAFGRLYDRYARMVHGILLGRVPRGEVDDLMHDCFLQAMSRLHSLRDTASFGGWLAALTRNRAIDYHRRSKDADRLPEDLESHGAAAGADAEAMRALAAIRAMPEAYRRLIAISGGNQVELSL